MKSKNKVTATKSNKLIDAGFFKNLNGLEIRIINLAISKLNPKRQIEQEKRFEFTVKEFMDFNQGLSLKTGDLYKNIKAAVKNLSSVWFEAETIEGYDKTEVSLITMRSYADGKGRFMIEFNDYAMPYLAEIKNNYTSILLENFGMLKSEYALKFYEIFSRWSFKGKYQITIDDLKHLLNVSKKYDRYNNFNLRVLSPALREINSKTNLNVDFKPIRTGREITHLEFVILDKSKAIESKSERPKFPHKNKYGNFVKLDRQSPKMSSVEYGNYARDCLKILEGYYEKIEDVTKEDLLHYWIFLAVNQSNRSKLGNKQTFIDELKKRGYKIVDCELVKVKKEKSQQITGFSEIAAT